MRHGNRRADFLQNNCCWGGEFLCRACRFLGGTGVNAFCLHLMYSLGSPVPKLVGFTCYVGKKPCALKIIDKE